MNRKLPTLSVLSFFYSFAFSQFSMIAAPISVTFSQNGMYSVKSTSDDDEFPTRRGESVVYKNGKEIYKINRAFDLCPPSPYTLVISNDGTTVAYFKDYVFSTDEESKNITVYKNGRFYRAYTLLEFTGCNPEEQKCNLTYNNFDEVVDLQKSNYGTPAYRKVFTANASEKDIFLNEEYLVVHDDTVYSVDTRKIVTVFDLKKPEIICRKNFDEIYSEIKNFERPKSNIKYFNLAIKYIPDFTELKTGRKLADGIGEICGLKFVPAGNADFNKYNLYRLQLTGYLNKKGKFEIETFTCDENLDAPAIRTYLDTVIFSADFLPPQIQKQYFHYFFGGYRKPNDSIAAFEKFQEEEERKKERERRMGLDSVASIYIPKDLEDCFTQLDKILNNADKNQIRQFKSNDKTGLLHLNLGMWIRNNWGLWGGSRLLKYFSNRGISHPDSMSGIILYCYYDWLKGNRSTAQDWEKSRPEKR